MYPAQHVDKMIRMLVTNCTCQHITILTSTHSHVCKAMVVVSLGEDAIHALPHAPRAASPALNAGSLGGYEHEHQL